jgi:hypothetical protein
MFALTLLPFLLATVFQQADPTVCALFSADDVASVLGEPVVANNRFGCEYDSLPEARPFKVIRYIPGYPSANDFQADSRRVATDNDGVSTFTPIDGVGDEAYVWHDGLGYTRLDMRSGSQSVEIFVDSGVFGTQDVDARVAIARQLAAIAVDRLTTTSAQQ